MKNITVKELKTKLDSKEDLQIIDVRDDEEYEICNIGGDLIPLDLLEEYVERLSKNKPVIIHCHLGGRSEEAIEILEKKYAFSNLYNLKGGIDAWAREIDPAMPEY